MANITIKNIPDDVYATIKEAAKDQHRSVNSYVIQLLASTATNQSASSIQPHNELMERLQKLRARMKPQVEDSVDELRRIRGEGEMYDESR